MKTAMGINYEDVDKKCKDKHYAKKHNNDEPSEQQSY